MPEHQSLFMFTNRQIAQWSASWTTQPIDDYFERRRIEDVYLRKGSGTKLKEQPSILVDLGSQINIIGRNTMKEFAGTTEDVNLQKTRDSP